LQSETGKLSVKEKIGYSLGDGAANFIFQTIMLLQLSFYTNTFGIGAGVICALNGTSTIASGSLPQIYSTLSAAPIKKSFWKTSYKTG